MPNSKNDYTGLLEARAQRGEMTHQKEFAMSILKSKNMKESEKPAPIKKEKPAATKKEKEGEKQ